MNESVITLVKIPITEIEAWIRARHDLPSVLSEFRIEDNSLVLYFYDKEGIFQERETQLPKNPAPKRRIQKKRNRMKTRGWNTVARITNSKDQKCTIYEPFVKALQNPTLTLEEQKKLVEEILRTNKNKPSEDSIRYYLENTLEYLKGIKEKPESQSDQVLTDKL